MPLSYIAKKGDSKTNLNESKREGPTKRMADESFSRGPMLLEDECNYSMNKCDESNDANTSKLYEGRKRAQTQGLGLQLKLPLMAMTAIGNDDDFKVEESCGTYRVVEPDIREPKKKYEIKSFNECINQPHDKAKKVMQRQCRNLERVCIECAEVIDSSCPIAEMEDVCENDGFYPLLFAF